jgi:hypothetical protein
MCIKSKISFAIKAALSSVLLASFVPMANAGINDGLMAYYNFDDCSANDSSGNNNNGTIKGNLSCISGIVTKALQFDGASYITVPNAASLHPTTQLTMSFWIRVDDFTNQWSGIINKGATVFSDCSASREYAVWLQNISTLTQTSAGDSNCQLYVTSKNVTSKKVAKGKWIHYASIVDRVKHIQSIYINGILSAKTVDNYSSFNINSHDLRIGNPEETHATFSPFKGALDEIRLYNRVLTPAEINSLYYQGVPVNGTIKSMATHTVTCLNATTAQSITIPATTASAYNCEAKGLIVKPQDHITITIDGDAQ